MINPTLPPIEINGITYDVKFEESTDEIILMSQVQDVVINASDITSKAYNGHRYVNETGDDDCQDSDMSRYIEEHSEAFIRDHFAKGEVSVWPSV